MPSDKIRVLVAGVPFAYQDPHPDGRWLSEEQIARIRSISPRIDLTHSCRDEMAAGFTQEPPEVALVETAGADPSGDVLFQVIRSADFKRVVTPNLRWVMSCSSGVEHLIPALDESVVLTNSSGVHANAIAESVIGAVLFHSKRIRDRLAHQARHEWEVLQCRELAGQTIVIIGTGDIGSSTARYAHAFGMRVIGVRRTPQPTEEFDEVVGSQQLAEVLPRADYVLIACPLTKETENLVGEREFAAMKRGCFFMNVARGKIVDEKVLISRLRDGTLSGAFLDAHVQEPLPAEHPFWDLPTVTVIPHDSHSSQKIGDNTFELFCDNLERYVGGRPLRNVIRRELGY